MLGPDKFSSVAAGKNTNHQAGVLTHSAAQGEWQKTCIFFWIPYRESKERRLPLFIYFPYLLMLFIGLMSEKQCHYI